MQVAAYSDAADDTIGEHRQQHGDRRHLESTPHGAHPERSDRHQQRGDADEAADEPVDLFDCRVPAGHVDEPLVVAVGPVVAPEATPGEANDRAGDGEEADARHRDDRDLAESPQRHRHSWAGGALMFHTCSMIWLASAGC